MHPSGKPPTKTQQRKARGTRYRCRWMGVYSVNISAGWNGNKKVGGGDFLLPNEIKQPNLLSVVQRFRAGACRCLAICRASCRVRGCVKGKVTHSHLKICYTETFSWLYLGSSGVWRSEKTLIENKCQMHREAPTDLRRCGTNMTSWQTVTALWSIQCVLDTPVSLWSSVIVYSETQKAHLQWDFTAMIYLHVSKSPLLRVALVSCVSVSSVIRRREQGTSNSSNLSRAICHVIMALSGMINCYFSMHTRFRRWSTRQQIHVSI